MTFLSDEGFNRLKTIHRLRKVLKSEHRSYVRKLHARCGVGLTNEEFDSIVRELAATGWCSLQVGGLGADVVVLNEQFNNVNVLSDAEANDATVKL